MKKIGLFMLAAMLATGAAGMQMTVMAEETQTQEDGGLLGALLGGSGLSDLFAEGGELSSLLSEDGELGKLLSEDGELAQLFSENGALAQVFSEDGALAQAFSEDGALGSLLGQGSEAVGEVLSQLTDENSELRSTFDGFVSSFTDENGEFDPEKATSLLDTLGVLDENNNLNVEEITGLIGGFIGGEMEAMSEAADMSGLMDEDNDAYLYLDDAVLDAAEAYVTGVNAEHFDASDAVFFVPMTVASKRADDGTVLVLGDFWQFNYELDGENLVFTSGGSTPALLTMEEAEDGTFTVIDAAIAQDGEGNWADIESFCEQTDATTDAYLSATSEESRDIVLETKLSEYVAEHEEVKAVDMNGDLIAVEDLEADLDQRIDAMLMAIFASLSDEFPADEEAMTE